MEGVKSLEMQRANGLAITPDGQTAYVAAQKAGSPTLAILSLQGQRQVGSVSLPNTPRAELQP